MDRSPANQRRSWLAQRSHAFGPSPIQQLSILAQQRNAINLAEGFPDFPAPLAVKEAAVAAINADHNQYRHVQGVLEKVAQAFYASQGVPVDPSTQVTICCGQSEAMAATVLAVVDVGDEVVLLDPAYETYEACVIMAGGKPIYVSLDPPEWTLDLGKLEDAMSPRTKAVVVNSPHNPTGKVFSHSELAGIASLCCKYDCLAITDEVYEHITFDDAKHASLAAFRGMQERTIVTSSLSKTFSVTGWRVGWAIAPAEISATISNIHVKLTDSAPAPFQEAALVALRQSEEFYQNLKLDYTQRRDFVCNMLTELGFSSFLKPQGSFFVFAQLPRQCGLADFTFCAQVIENAGVAIVPGRGFFHPHAGNVKNGQRIGTSGTDAESNCTSEYGASVRSSSSRHDLVNDRYVRIAFCKDIATLRAARNALRGLDLFRSEAQ